MKILLVEDDTIIAENIKDYLEENNFLVTWCSQGSEGLKEALKNKYDIFIFDIMLPLLNGIDLLKEVKQNKIDTPVILLTAKEDLETKERGFLNGADDYITKPFSLKELLLRVRSILRRVHKNQDFQSITL